MPSAAFCLTSVLLSCSSDYENALRLIVFLTGCVADTNLSDMVEKEAIPTTIDLLLKSFEKRVWVHTYRGELCKMLVSTLGKSVTNSTLIHTIDLSTKRGTIWWSLVISFLYLNVDNKYDNA